MKSLIQLFQSFRLVLLAFFTSQCFSQGTIYFYNHNLRHPVTGALYTAPVTLPDGSGVAGGAYTAGLFLVRSGQLELLATASFNTRGYFVPQEVVVPGISVTQPATVRVRVWETSAGSFENAMAMQKYHGEFPTGQPENNLLLPVLGGGPGGGVQPALLNGLQPLTLIPEPSTIALLALAAAVLGYSLHFRKARYRMRSIITALILSLNVFENLAQGSIFFYNRGLRDPNGRLYEAPVRLPDGSLAEGDRFTAGLFLVDADQLTLIGTSPFRPGGAAGFFYPTVFDVPGVLPGSSGTFRARVWETAAGSYDAAVATGLLHGEFPTFSGDNTFVVGPLAPQGGPIDVPSTDGILPFTLVPEPNSVATFCAGAMIILFTTGRKGLRTARPSGAVRP